MIDVSLIAISVVCLVVMCLYWRSIALGDRARTELYALDHEAMEWLRNNPEYNILSCMKADGLSRYVYKDGNTRVIVKKDPADAILAMKDWSE